MLKFIKNLFKKPNSNTDEIIKLMSINNIGYSITETTGPLYEIKIVNYMTAIHILPSHSRLKY